MSRMSIASPLPWPELTCLCRTGTPPLKHKLKSAPGSQARSQRLAHSQRFEERVAALEKEIAAACLERDAASEKAAAARLERDAAASQAAAAASRADAWVGVTMAMQRTVCGLTLLQECPQALQEEVRNPTLGAVRQSKVFLGIQPWREVYSRIRHSSEVGSPSRSRLRSRLAANA